MNQRSRWNILKVIKCAKFSEKLSESCPWRTWHWFPWITRNSKALCQLPDPPNFHRSTTKRRSKRWWSLWMSLHLYHGTLPIYSKRFRKTPRKFYLCNHPLMRWHWKEQLHHVSTTWTGQVIWGRGEHHAWCSKWCSKIVSRFIQQSLGLVGSYETLVLYI